MTYHTRIFAFVAATLALGISAMAWAADSSDAGNRFDGTYVGVERSSGLDCPTNTPTKRVVTNGVLTLNTFTNLDFVAIVHADGRITGGGERITVDGTIKDGVLTMTQYAQRCVYEETSRLQVAAH